jgi:glycosyltransferase involved in cell wall biosynthesis
VAPDHIGERSRVIYLCLQATQEGQASYAHVHEIVSGLRDLGWEIVLYEPSCKSATSRGAFARFVQFVIVQARLVLNLRKVDIVYIRNHFAAFLTAAWAKVLRVSFVVEVNGPYEDMFTAYPWIRRYRWLFVWLARTQMKWASALITVTPELRDMVLKDAGNKHVQVIPNAANIEVFNPRAKTTHKLPKSFAAFFGGLAVWQGVDTLCAAIRHPNWPTDVSLVIMGDGVDRHKVEQLSAENPNVLYLGTVPYHQVPGIVAQSVGGLIPKNNVGGHLKTGLSPLKLYETLACGVPAVVTDIPGQSDLVRTHECGIVVGIDDPAGLANAVRFLHSHPEGRREMGRNGRKTVEERHSWKIRAKATEHVLLSLSRR